LRPSQKRTASPDIWFHGKEKRINGKENEKLTSGVTRKVTFLPCRRQPLFPKERERGEKPEAEGKKKRRYFAASRTLGGERTRLDSPRERKTHIT